MALASIVAQFLECFMKMLEFFFLCSNLRQKETM